MLSEEKIECRIVLRFSLVLLPIKNYSVIIFQYLMVTLQKQRGCGYLIQNMILKTGTLATACSSYSVTGQLAQPKKIEVTGF